ncbi:MAG: glycoside hydrolase family 30 protein [Defluviitaleaceae bacterium]|nr:glycoside hydrolase family 30 protein [Defluviitaleaceae bacterium]
MITLTLDQTKTYQTIDGFGFFGSYDAWWNNPPGDTPIVREWVDMVLLDLGITMWRNEPYAHVPFTSTNATNEQNSTWDKQRPFVKLLHERAKELDIPLKIILSVWSPPGQWKYNNHTRKLTDEKNSLKPEHYEDFGHWLVETLTAYKEIGVDVYAISPQNEPLFDQTYSSASYSAYTYVDMLNVVAPIIHQSFPDVFIFGAEGMLEQEHDEWTWNPPQRFHHALLGVNGNKHEGPDYTPASEEAMKDFIFAHHGYNDGIIATKPELLHNFWKAERALIGDERKLWMTETSSYKHVWREENALGGLDLAVAIQSALIHGNISAWVYWQGHEAITKEPWMYSLFNVPNQWPRHNYNVAKHFYKYIRPGAVRIGVDLNGGNEDLMASAFSHAQQGTTIVMINTSANAQAITLESAQRYRLYITEGEVNDEHVEKGMVQDSIVIPPYSVITLCEVKE